MTVNWDEPDIKCGTKRPALYQVFYLEAEAAEGMGENVQNEEKSYYLGCWRDRQGFFE